MEKNELPTVNPTADNSQVNQEALAKAQEFIDPLVLIVKYAVQKSHTDIDDEVIKQLQEALGKIDLSTPIPTEDDVAGAVIDIITEVSELTAYKWDDKLMAFVRSVYEIIVGKGGIQTWIEKIKANIQQNAIKRQARRAFKAAQKAKKAAQNNQE